MFLFSIYVDAIINHMARTDLPAGTQGTAGSLFDATIPTFQAVPYGIEDFNSAESCPNADGTIHDYNNPRDVRNCRLEQLNDLDHSRENVRNTIANFMNHLIDMGVAGFRIDAAKHMWPENLKTIYEKLNHLSTDFFPPGTRPLIYQEVIDLGGEAISSQEYIDLGRVTEFKYGIKLGEALRGKNQLK